MKYTLDENGNPVFEPDLIKWAKWIESEKRTVANETVGDSKISTVFLGIDHAFDGGPPVLWETMVFGGELDQHQERCGGSQPQAQKMHNRMVQMVKDGYKNNP